MSGYRNYVPWNKHGSSNYTTPGRKDSALSSYEPSFTAQDKTSRLISKYSSYGSGYQRDTSSSRDAAGISSEKSGAALRIRPTLDKRDTSHPPVTCHTIAKPGSRSRDPSPIDRSERSSSSSYSYNKLYPPTSYSRSVSKERNDSTNSVSSIPKYSSKSKISDESVPKYSGRSSISKDSTTRTSKEDLTSLRYKPTTTRTISREDLNSPQKYISSRFLPKNTVEKSLTAYTRPSTIRANETSRRNRELLNSINTQIEQKRPSRPVSRSSTTSEEIKSTGDSSKEKSTKSSTDTSKKAIGEQNVETKKEQTDKETAVISQTPISSYLDMKFSTPNDSPKEISRESSQVGQIKAKLIQNVDSNNVLRNNSTTSLNQSKNVLTKANSNESNNLSRNNSTNSINQPSKTNVSSSSPKQLKSAADKKLPPQMPKSDSSKSLSTHGTNAPNKDFRKSILNMNPDGKFKREGNRSNSVSSESESYEPHLSEMTDISENLTSCKSYHSNASNSKLESKNKFKKGSKSETSTSTTTSGSEDDSNCKTKRSGSKSKDKKSLNSSRTSVILSADELSTDKSPKPPLSPRTKSDTPKTEAEAKSFLMRALAPVTSFFKVRHQDSNEKVNWMDSSPENTPENINEPPESKTISIRRIESGEKAWWLDSSNSENAPKDIPRTKPIRHVESGERAWWLDENAQPPEGVKVYPENSESQSEYYWEKHRIRHIDSGERAWWLNSSEDIAEDSKKYDSSQKESWQHEENQELLLLGDRASPDGLEAPKDETDDNLVSTEGKAKRPTHIPLFISKHTNIDDILGGTTHLLSPLMDKIFSYQMIQEQTRSVSDDCRSADNGQQKTENNNKFHQQSHYLLDDAALQLYRDGDYGSYLDLEASISEQQEEFEGFQSNKKNAIVLRTQLSVRVHTIIEKLLSSEGRELRRALFSLKQIFQEDKDLVHEFVQNDGLACLIKVGSEADQNYQNYILRALGQVMLYVDGMNGVMEHNQTIQWLYSLISSKFRLVVKTALKLLLVFAEYTDSNCMLLIKAIETVDCSRALLPWHNIMKLLKDFDSADTELLIYATTLINKVLNGIPDQDTYYDQTDALEEHGIETIIQRYMARPGTDLDLLQQFQIYEAVLQYEDDDTKDTPLRILDETVKKTLRARKSIDSVERRKSRRHSTGTTPVHSITNLRNNMLQANLEDDESSSSQSSDLNNMNLKGGYNDSSKANDAGVTPALRRRRERAERQRSFLKEQQESGVLFRGQNIEENDENVNDKMQNGNVRNKNGNRQNITPFMNAVNRLESEESLAKQPWILSMMYGNQLVNQNQRIENTENANENERNVFYQLKKVNTVKDLTQKLSNQSTLHSPTSDENKMNRIGDMTGLISKAKEGLAKSKSKVDVVKSPTNENVPKVVEIKKSENELRWEELVNNLNRPLNLCDLDFTDLVTDDECDILTPVVESSVPPPPPSMPLESGVAPPPPPLSNRMMPPVPNPPPVFGTNFSRNKQTETKIPIKKTKKTVKLFWKEVREDPINSARLKTGLIWDELSPVTIDTQKLEHLFESRAKDLITKKQQEMNKNKEVIVLDPKRSNAINIGMTKLPPPRSIKTAILKMDATIMNREGIEKLLTMLPTEEERTKIQDAQAANPDLPLGSAEQFLLTLASISELPARLRLWAFKLDFECSEREIAEPLMDLKQGIELLKVNKTFRGVLSTLLSVGNFLNGNEVKGFQIEYLAKVPEVKDTVHKHSLLHHLCHIVMEKFPDATDLYSEIGAITRASKTDFDELSLNIQRLEADCKASWDHLKLITKHDGSTMMKGKMIDFLADCAERIILLSIIHRRVMNRYNKFLSWLGIPLHQIQDIKPNEFCRIISEFALEYRTTRERVLQQLEKKANHRERNKTRGKMITDIGKFSTKEDRADAELRQLLGSDISDAESMQGTLPRRQHRKDSRFLLGKPNGNLTDGDDEILESLVKTATKGPSSRTAPRERKRTRNTDRKSLRRTLKSGLSEEEKNHLSAYIKGY